MATPPKIRSLNARAVLVPMAQPHRTASGVITESPLVLADIALDNGVTGHSYVFCYTRLALAPTLALLREISALVLGEPAAPRDIERRLASRFRLLGRQGLVGIAAAAIDMALWDAAARGAGLPLASLLGAAPRPIPAYGAIGYDGPAGCAATAQYWAERGFRGVKAKIGYPTVDEDLAAITAIRDALGDGIDVMVDYNQCLTPTEAVARGRRLDSLGLAWIEEPTLAEDHAGHARIAAELATPIQAGENWWGAEDVRRAFDAGACDVVMLDVMKIGGVSGWLRAAAVAEARAVRVSNHLFPEISAHLLAATATADWFEYAEWFNPIIAEPLVVSGGMVRAAERPGSGIEWDEAAVARFQVG